MRAPRLAPLPPERWSGALRAFLDGSRADGPGREPLFGTLAHHPAVAAAWLGLARTLTHEGTLSARDRELVVLRTAHRLGGAFVWSRHRAHAVERGRLSAAEADATARPTDGCAWPAQDAAVLEAADALVDRADLPDALWARLSADRSPRQLVELLVLAGQCAMVCTLLRTLRTPPDPQCDRGPAPAPLHGPPDGRRPAP
ncbi:carboxymuconolactone decarboxylase family protein [Streptomyces sp. NPDC060194]|uniref:carboxymuconolactone decarboxylase family protein n=1 Tax=Streptomyces sp. NPDC060194 TaxID=3347069 RepID=UPI0036484956